MKTFYFFIATILISGNIFSQSLKVLDTNNVDISGTTVTVNGIVPDGTKYFYAHIQNVGNQAIQTLVCRQVVYENGLIGNSFCFGPHCYTADTANFPVNIVAGDIDSSFDASIIISDAGISKIKYTFWDKNNPSDTISLTVKYDIATSIDYIEANGNFISNPFPVPAKNYINFKYNFDKDAIINLYDITGKKIKAIKLNAVENHIRIPVYNLNAGIYYYSLLIDKKKIITDKFIVN